MRLEPWPSYSRLTQAQRARQLRTRVHDARTKGDDAYAQALTSAVYAYERPLTQTRREARNTGRTFKSWQRS